LSIAAGHATLNEEVAVTVPADAAEGTDSVRANGRIEAQALVKKTGTAKWLPRFF
jgi:hypothetical protein